MVKITPAHDFNDWAVGQRHRLPVLSIFNLDATVNDNAPAKYRGLDRYAARKAVLADLQAPVSSCRKSRTGWSCRAAGAPAKSSSRC